MVALVAGSTGLVGGQLLDLLLQDSFYDRVIAVSRSPLPKNNTKLTNLVFDFSKLNDHTLQLHADHVYCCLGTTIKKAKSKEAFRKVDYDYPLELAKIARQNGSKKYLLVSALGANKNSGIFYNRVKGDVEEAISKVGIESLHILRPSLLVGPRVEQRSGEDAAKFFYKYLNFLVPQKYKGIESIKVARAMIAFAKAADKGNFVHESNELQQY